ncbi:nicotinamide riboside kinase [Pseudomonas fluvialis]|uniref:Nicotinamide riboside kinase n=1 Tax=Pseudomonas fluvialis TaxID=1793966 RepID=A0A7X0EW44_9PSED|nr:AAA family ATPase [Pseudomonas fluvialis]MBB6343460.1 nicotinamide riboside kinase [Pseudomonas fluvialis]
MKVLVLTGPESSGKSTLSLRLQQAFGGLCVAEQVRLYIEQSGRDTHYGDVDIIARQQLAAEDAARAARPHLLILDTHLLSNLLWSRLLFNNAPDWLEAALHQRQYDLHLLLDPRGVAWQADGQRCQPQLQERLRFHQDCQAWLEQHDQHYLAIGGDWQRREAQALEQVERWLKASSEA